MIEHNLKDLSSKTNNVFNYSEEELNRLVGEFFVDRKWFKYVDIIDTMRGMESNIWALR